ncbi:MAG: arsenate reductase ArsC [Dehalococcoidia bacterium]|nr:arsenate reductase ArsC [Dehalococcoidia bacterium]
MNKESSGRRRVLFVCTHNSARSQMAEGSLRHLAGEVFEAASAGTEAGEPHPLTVAVMAEEGIDVSGQHAKSVDEFVQQRFDYVVTVCDDAREACPYFPHGGKRLHWSLPDPASAEGTEEERRAVFRAVRDAVRERVEQFLKDSASEGGRLP